MTEEAKPKITGLYHVGLQAHDPIALAKFYQDLMGMQIVGKSDKDNPHPIVGQSAFLSSRPDKESHQIAFFETPDAAHIAFKVDTLADLRAFYQRVVEQGISISYSLNHGVSLSFYFLDPEENLIEIYWATGLSYGQPYAQPIDLSLPEDILRRDVADLTA